MTRVLALADRLSAASLTLLAFVNAIVFAAFLIAAALLAGRAHAEGAACVGHDLVAELEKSDPALVAKARADAAKVPNGQGLLWKIEKTGASPSYLFGTMHVADPRVLAMTPAAKDAFEGSQTLVIETTDILDMPKMTAAMMKRLDLTMFTDQTTLPSLLSPEDRPIVDAALSARGIPLSTVVKMKPWLLSMMLAIPNCENLRKANGDAVLDLALATKAKAEGKIVVGLESGMSQVEAIASLPTALHVASLVDIAKLGPRMDDVFESMIDLYQRGQTGMLISLSSDLLPAVMGEPGEDFVDFEEVMIVKRNHGMAVNAQPFLDKGKAFIAVGAAHLPGPEGLVELLRKDGYTVSRAD